MAFQIAIPIILAAVGAAGGAASNLLSGSSSQQYYDDKVTSLEKEAQATKDMGRDQLGLLGEDTAFKLGQHRGNERRGVGAQKAATASSGLGAGSVTGFDLNRDTLTKSQLDESLIRHNANLAAWSIDSENKAKVRAIETEAESNRAASRNARAAAGWAAATSLLTGAGKVADIWSQAGNSSKTT
jgi:hypothetical protein